MTAGIDLDNITLEYPVYNYSSLSIKSALISKLASTGVINRTSTSTVHVKSLDNVSLRVRPNDRVAIIGGNGAGKTSLLKVISGIYDPSQGQRRVQGHVTTLLGTGFGLDDEATGYQNIILGGIALGYSRKDMIESFDEIASFTQLGDFLNMPLRTYSAGMRAQLAFAIATCRNPEILLIDEGIGAGDAQFMKRANERIEKFVGASSILIMASHAEELLDQFCNKCLYLQAGRPIFYGDYHEGMEMYRRDYNLAS
ncbi:MAG: ATP-binding cassette domain-containing protein [Alphaproteobacteria bacterium]|nr:ATP-binding cassette domain-containing protein [Alphaproteobacteria bacterium]